MNLENLLSGTTILIELIFIASLGIKAYKKVEELIRKKEDNLEIEKKILEKQLENNNGRRNK